MRGWQWQLSGLLCVFSAWGLADPSFIPLKNMEAIRANYRLDGYDRLAIQKQVTVAVIAQGFSSLSERVAKELTYLRGHELRALGEPQEGSSDEGTLLVATIAAMTNYQPERVRFVLVPVANEQEFIAALERLPESEPDIVYNSITFPDQGHSSPALKAAITNLLKKTQALWFQAAGDEAARTTFAVVTGQLHGNGWLSFQNGSTSVGLESEFAFLPGQLTVSWHGASEAIQRQLDQIAFKVCLYRVDPNTPVEQQKPEVCSDSGPQSRSLRLKLDRNEGRGYRVFVLPQAGTQPIAATALRFHFQPFTDRKATRDGAEVAPFRWTEATGQRSLAPPAELAGLITVGGKHRQSSLGPTWEGNPKPELLVDRSEVSFEDGRELQGSAVAAALAAGTYAMIQSAEPKVSTVELVLRFRAPWPRAEMEREGWRFDEALLTGLVKQHPGVTKYLAKRLGSGWIGVQRTQEGLFRVATILPPHRVAAFQSKPGESNLFFLSSPDWDLNGESITHSVLPNVSGKNGVVLIPSSVKLDRSVEIVHFPNPEGVPGFMLPPAPRTLFNYLAKMKLGQGQLIDEEYVSTAFSFPAAVLEKAPKPAPPPLPAKLPEPPPQPVAKYETGPLYLRGDAGAVSGRFTFTDGFGNERDVRASSNGPHDKSFVGNVAVGTTYHWYNDGGASWTAKMDSSVGNVQTNRNNSSSGSSRGSWGRSRSRVVIKGNWGF